MGNFWLMLLLLSSCAPMPGPSSGNHMGAMSEDELIAELDATRGDALMIHLHRMNLDLRDCEPASLKEMKEEGRLIINEYGFGEAIDECIRDQANIFQKFVGYTIFQPMGCADGSVMYDPWYPKYDHCETWWVIVHGGDSNNHVLAHELRHAQGYDDVLY